MNPFLPKTLVVVLLAAMSPQLSAADESNSSRFIDKGVAMPASLDKFIALSLIAKTGKIDWHGVFNAVDVDIDPDQYTDKDILIPQMLGLRMADGIMAIQAKHAELLGKAASDIEKLAAKLNVGENDLSRARRVRALTNEGKWLDAYQEFSRMQQDIMRKMGENPKDPRSSLLLITSWIQGSRYSSRLILAHYSDATSNILCEPLLVKDLIAKCDALPANVRQAPSVAPIVKALPELHKIMGSNDPIPKDQIATVDKLASGCVKAIVEGK